LSAAKFTLRLTAERAGPRGRAIAIGLQSPRQRMGASWLARSLAARFILRPMAEPSGSQGRAIAVGVRLPLRRMGASWSRWTMALGLVVGVTLGRTAGRVGP